MKTKVLVSFLTISLVVLCIFLLINLTGVKAKTSHGYSNSEKMRQTRQLELEGKRFLKQGRFFEAEKKFQEADDPKFWLYENAPNGVARFWLRAAYYAQSKYDEALASVNSNLAIIPDHQNSLDEKILYEALIKYRNDGTTEPIYRMIDLLKSKYADQLPPVNYKGVGTLSLYSTILRAYNTIGDHDAGIRFIDEILAWTHSQVGTHLSSIALPKTAEEALALGRWNLPDSKSRNRYWREYKFVWQYLTVREAFEQDKADGFKGCAGSPPGQPCIGKATKALIQSDYFPW